ncbi:MAG: hypothetical protein L6R42_008436, partial [Xanthoria sp. 1 TBL-2021]
DDKEHRFPQPITSPQEYVFETENSREEFSKSKVRRGCVNEEAVGCTGTFDQRRPKGMGQKASLLLDVVTMSCVV